MIVLKQVIHYPITNSVEAQWVDRAGQDEDGNDIDTSVKCQSYADVQMDMFRDDASAMGTSLAGHEALIALVEANITPYVPPTPVVPLAVTRRQARQALLLRNKLNLVQPAIDAIPDVTQRALMQIEWDDSLDFVRTRASVIAIGAAIGLDSAALDEMFTFAASLP